MKLFKLIDINKEKVRKEIKQEEKFSILIENNDELNEILKNNEYFDFLEKNKNNISKIIIRLTNFKNIELNKFLFLEHYGINCIILGPTGFFEEGIKKLEEDIIKLNEIIDEIKKKNLNEEENIIEIIKWISENVFYDKKYNIKDFSKESKEKLKERLLLSHILKNKKTNCAGFSNIFYIIANLLDINVNIENSKFHSWNSVIINNKKIHIDPTNLANELKAKNILKIDKDNYYVEDKKIKGFGLYTGNIEDIYE